MNFKRIRLTEIVIVVMSILCLVAAVIAVRVSGIIIARHGQIEKSKPVDARNIGFDDDKILNTNRIKEHTFYFNGQKVNGSNAYMAHSKEFLVPLDYVLSKINTKFRYFGADGILESAVNGKKIVIELGKGSFLLDGKEISLKNAPGTADGHIQVPAELLNIFNGFKVSGYADKSSVFLNYYPDYEDGVFGSLKVLKLANGTGSISDLPGKKSYWKRQADIGKNESIEISKDKTTYMLKTGEKIYMLRTRNSLSPYFVNINPFATLSEDGRFLYWIDENKKATYIYNIADEYTKELGDYPFRAMNGKDGSFLSNGASVLRDYKEGWNYKRLILTDADGAGEYCFIERNGKTVVEGRAVFSPDRKKMLYYKDDNCFVINSDGTEKVLVGSTTGFQYRWINNSRIFVRSKDEMYVASYNGRNLTRVQSEWRKVGQTSKGDVFFTKGNTLYCENTGAERKILELPWTCEYLYALSSKGPYIAVSSGMEDGVFLLSGSKIEKIGKSSLLLKDVIGGYLSNSFDRSIRSSPDNSRVLVYQRENGFVSANIINTKNFEKKSFMLDYPVNEGREKKADLLETKWLSGNRIVVYSSEKAWMADFKGDVKIYEWIEKEGGTIEAIMP